MGVNLNGTISGQFLMTDNCCTIRKGCILVRKYFDQNCNANTDWDTADWKDDEQELPGWTFTLTPGNYPTVTTNSLGEALFCNGIPPGTYDITETQQPGWSPSTPPGGIYPMVNLNGYGVQINYFGNCTCCANSTAFNTAAANVQTNGTLGNCTLNYAATGLTTCMQITYDWGDGQSTGPIIGNNIPVSHTYSNTNTYTVCYTIEVLDPATNTVCLTYKHCDNVYVICPPVCTCKQNSKVTLTQNGVAYNIGCANGQVPPTLACPAGPVSITSDFGCVDANGNACTGGMVHWTLKDQTGYIIKSGYTVTPVSLSFTKLEIGNPAAYTLSFATLCPSDPDSCRCESNWNQGSCCGCGTPSPLTYRPPNGLPISIPCNNTTAVPLPCPAPGHSLVLLGTYPCTGSNCPKNAQIDWKLTEPNGSMTTGTATGNPVFGISLKPYQYSTPGNYTLVVSAMCGTQTCSCTYKFYVNCPNQCPCLPQQVFNALVNKGFTITTYNSSCKACLRPKNLDDCDFVEWFIDNSTISAGSTIGNQTFCINVSASIFHTVTMKVTRYTTAGMLCNMASKKQFFKIYCSLGPPKICVSGVLSNNGFQEGAVAGGLNPTDVGKSTGWKSAYGNPMIVEGHGASDGWSVMLSGNRDSADVLTREKSICWVKDTGTIFLRLHNWKKDKDTLSIYAKPGEAFVLRVYRDSFGIPNPLLDTCPSKTCFELLNIPLVDLPSDSSDWFTIEVPYNLKDWTAEDNCGDSMIISHPPRVLIHPVAYATNEVSSSPGSDTKTMVLLDEICFDGKTVGVINPQERLSLRIFPNPNTGLFTVDLPLPASPGMKFRILDLTGRLVLEKRTEQSVARQSVDGGILPNGLYFIQIVSDGQVLGVEKFVKQ
jgi:hypothetical protein